MYYICSLTIIVFMLGFIAHSGTIKVDEHVVGVYKHTQYFMCTKTTYTTVLYIYGV